MKSLLVIATLILFTNSPAMASDLCSLSDTALKHAVNIRKLKLKKNVPCTAQGKSQVRKYILDTIDEKLPASKLKHEALVYRAIGFIPDDFDYKEQLVTLYTEQIGGYYDPDKKRFVMAAWMPASMQLPIAVHELTHAIQDQHFKLNDLMNLKKFRTDQLLAHAALVEGDATAVMTDYARDLMNQPPLQKTENISSILAQNVLSIGFMQTSVPIPMSLKLQMLFPYTSGLSFAHHLLQKQGYQEINSAFQKLPRSTEEILHPEKYFSSKKEFIEIEAEQGSVYSDTLGEFSITALLSNYLADNFKAAHAAAGWHGDTISINEKPGETRIVWKTMWDTEKDAEEFVDAYQTVLQKRTGKSSLNTNIHFLNNQSIKLTSQGRKVNLFWSLKDKG